MTRRPGTRQIALRSRAEVLAVGIGDSWRGDDGVGPRIARAFARRLRQRGLDHRAQVLLRPPADAAALVEAWRGARCVLLFDGVVSGSAPGTIHRLDATAERAASLYFHGSIHSSGVAEAVERARLTRALPERLIIYGIEGKRWTEGAPLSHEVEGAARRVLERALREIVAVPGAAHAGG